MIALQEDSSSSVTIGVADEHIGLVVGRGGRNLMEISQVDMMVFIFLFLYLVSDCFLLSMQLSGARIKISDRGDFLLGTSDRYMDRSITWWFFIFYW